MQVAKINYVIFSKAILDIIGIGCKKINCIYLILKRGFT